MTKYAKLISETQNEFAPKNKGSIINYNLNIQAMKADGYKEFVEAEKEVGKAYTITYKETKNKITEIATEIVPDPEAELEYAKKMKLDEALSLAYDRQENGWVEFKGSRFEMNESNRNNLRETQEALELMGQNETQWNDKDDNIVTLTLSDIQYIRLNLILNSIKKLWLEDYPNYKTQINECETVEEVESIKVKYGN